MKKIKFFQFFVKIDADHLTSTTSFSNLCPNILKLSWLVLWKGFEIKSNQRRSHYLYPHRNGRRWAARGGGTPGVPLSLIMAHPPCPLDLLFSFCCFKWKKKDFFIVFQETVDVAPQLKTGSAWEQHQYYKLLKVKLVIMARMLAEPVLTPWLK